MQEQRCAVAPNRDVATATWHRTAPPSPAQHQGPRRPPSSSSLSLVLAPALIPVLLRRFPPLASPPAGSCSPDPSASRSPA
ncbi:hypothetical protein CALCODRAFT_502657 [Calocera cornea HHB12733]|uniref:Uncharacterized protein n=1 Tax=Calocera cornea HHB12733 TaxID=1353952 RepID=A0A165D5R9_9BASI|nr:hypothetical protein CALCODRAFT_502657 [Calocera cornea HHB12733]